MKTSSNWGGYSEYAGNWTASNVEWTLNGISLCDTDLSGRAADWGGLGGTDGSNLIQSGTTAWCDDPISGKSNSVWYQMWVENLGASNPDPEFSTYQPIPGNLMESFIGGSNGCDYMDISDLTTSHYFTKSYGPCGGQYYFDCIEENDAYGLADNGTVTFSFCEGYDANQSNWLVMGNSSSTYYDFTMVNEYTDESTHYPPNENGSGSFTVRWENNL